jgi:VanZ family protein
VNLRSVTDTRGFLGYVLPALLYIVFLFWIGSIHTSLTIPQDFFARDKVDHFAAFGLLVLLALRALRFEMDTATWGRLVVAAVGISSLLGALLELWQWLLPYRFAEFGDWLADTLGAVLAGLASCLWIWWRGRHVPTG